MLLNLFHIKQITLFIFIVYSRFFFNSTSTNKFITDCSASHFILTKCILHVFWKILKKLKMDCCACFVQICLLTLTFLHESSLKSQTLGLLLVFALVTDDCKCSEKVSHKQNKKAEATHGHLQKKKKKKKGYCNFKITVLIYS